MNICKSCETETKYDEWSDYEKKICIDCQEDLNNEYNAECVQDTADMVQNDEAENWSNF